MFLGQETENLELIPCSINILVHDVVVGVVVVVGVEVGVGADATDGCWKSIEEAQ